MGGGRTYRDQAKDVDGVDQGGGVEDGNDEDEEAPGHGVVDGGGADGHEAL